MLFNNLLKKFFFLIILFNCNLATSSEKITHIDIDFIMNNSLAGKSIIEQLDKINTSNDKNFKKIANELKAEESKIISQKNILNEIEFKKKVDIFSNKVNKYKNERDDALTLIEKKKMNSQKILINKLTPILADYSQKNSISYILPKQNVIIGKKELDITKVILELLNTEIKNIDLK